jgi:virginiamycin B lyase
MGSLSKILRLISCFGLLSSFSHAATITGTVKGPDGNPFKGAFVEAQNLKTKMTVNVLSGRDGSYRAERLPSGEYRVSIRAVGLKSEPRSGVNLSANQSASIDFALQTGTVRWSDLSGYQGKELLPEGRGKDLLARQCFACHMFQSRMAATPRDLAGWTQAVNFMREVMHSRLGNVFSDEDATVLIAYLNSTFGLDSGLPRSPAELPGYQKTVRPFRDEALKIEYVEYQMPAPNRMPFSAAPDKDGYIWIPEFGPANRIGRLDPKTGDIEEFLAPNQGTASIHSAVPGPDGSVWIAEQASNKVGKWDPKTRAITEYQDTYSPGMQGLEDGGSKHTVRVGPDGKVWATAVNSALTVLDPKTGEFTHFRNVISPYGVEIDQDGNPWFAEFKEGGQIGKVESKTGKVTKWTPPTPHSWPRRIEIDSNGIIWFAEYRGGKIGRFDPKAKTFKEFQLPGPSPTPYALGIDKNNYIWYSSDDMDVIGRLDPTSGQVIEYPYLHAENMMKEFFLDSQGRMWYGSPPNNTVGYFYISELNEHASR